MLLSTLRGLRGHLGRLVATTLAVVFGVAFVAGTLVFADTARAGYTEAFARTAANVDVSVRPPADAGEEAGLLTSAQLAGIRRLPGVAAAEGRMVAELALLDRDGRPVTNFGLVGFAISTDGDSALRPFEIVGRAPGTGEAVLDTDSAQRLGYHVGDAIAVVAANGEQHRYRLVGLIDFGASQEYSGQSAVGLPAAVITTLTGTDGYVEFAIHARENVNPADLAGAVAGQLDPGARVLTGEERRTELVSESASWLDSFRLFLLLFGVISLIVAAFVIYNTFAVLGALRIRQTALLRCVGATRRQLFGATLIEAGLVGLVGGAAGILLGIGVAYGLVVLLNSQIRAGIPLGSPVLGPGAVATGLVLGVVVTVASAFVPAVRATRASPLAALRDQPTGATGRRRRAIRVVAAVLVGLLGIAVTAFGAISSSPEAAAVLIVAGGVVTFLAVLIASPLFVAPLSTVIGAVPARLFGTTARLAVANARRNPGRTAITAATLMIGVGLMSVFSVVFSSLGVTAARQIAAQFPVDIVANGLRYGNAEPTLPAGYAEAVRARTEFSAVAQVRTTIATVDGEPVRIGAIDPAALGTLITPPITEGRLADLAPGTAIVAGGRTWLGDIGTTVSVAGSGSRAELRIVAVASALAPGAGDMDLLVQWSEFASLAGEVPDTAVLAKTAPGVSAAQALAALDALGDEYPLVIVSSVAELSNSLESIVDSILAVLAGLLGITIVISLFGISNTLALSVVERTRESATIRALGLTRGQLRATLLIESLMMAAIGALVGLVFGLVFGAVLAARTLAELDPVVAVPWGWFGGIVLIVTVTAMLAAVLPARRATRASIVAAMADT